MKVFSHSAVVCQCLVDPYRIRRDSKKVFSFVFKLKIMSAIIIKGDKKSSKLISDLAKQLGANVIDIKTQQ